MSKTVDEKVVEMRFDNKQFEANVKTSMSTLDELKNSLKLGDASKGLENIDKASKNISFDTIASGVEALQKRFSTFGIVGMRVIQNITDSMMGLASKTTSFLTDGIIQGGKNRAMNLENAHFQLQGLLKDEEAVAAVMDDVNKSVDGTAYSLDAAAKIASQLTASGIKSGGELYSSLRAIAGVAAMTNSEYDEIGNIFAKVAGNGRLMSQELLQFSARGMNAAATLAKYLNLTESEVRDMVSDGAISFKMFSDAMDDAFGEHAKKANETFTGAISNIKAALARIGALFISPLVEQNGALVQLFNVIRQRINDIKSAIQPLADIFVKGVTTMANALTTFLTKLDIKTPIEKMMDGIIPKWDQFSSKLEAAGISADDFQKKLTEVAGKHGVSVDNLIQKYGSLGKVISTGKISKNIIIETLKSFVGIEKSASIAAEEITGKLETFNKVTKEIINGNYGNGAARVKALTDAGYEYATMQKLVNYIWERNGKTWKDCNISADELTNAISGLSKEELKSIGYTEEQASKIRELAEEAEKTGAPLNELISKMTKPSGRELIIDSFRNALKGLSSVMSAVKNAFTEMVKPLSTDVFTTVAEKIHSFSEKLVLSEENADKLKRTFKGLFSVLDLIRSIVGGAFRTAFNILSAVLGAFNLNVLDVTAYIGDAITKFRDWIKEHNLLAKAIEVVVPIIKSVADSIGNWVKNNEKIQNGIKNLISFLDSVGRSISNWIDGLKETDNIPQYIISGFINGLKSGASTIVNAMIELGRSILSAIKGVLGIHSPSTEFFAIGENVIQGFINGIKSGVSALLSLIGDIGNRCIGVLSQIDFAKIFAVGISGGIIYTANNLLNTIKAFAAPAAGIGHMTDSIGSFFDALSESIKPNKWKNMSKTIMELAVAVGILSASVYALAQLETGKLWGAIGALGALAAILGVLSFAVSKMDVSGGGFSKLSLVLMGVTASLYVMASAIKKLEFLNEDNIAPVLGGLTAMITGLAAILLALGKLTKGAGAKDISKAGSMLIKISAAMMLMTLTIKAISKLEPTEITKGIVCMSLFGGLITGLMAATKLAGKDVNNLGSVILKVSAAMLLMVGVIKVVSGLEPSEITKGVICMTLFGGLITGLMAATKLIGKNVGKIGSAMMGVSAAMMLMALTIKIVANMEPSEIAKGVVCITLFGGIVTGLIAATRLAGGNNLKGVAATLLAMSLSIGILAGVAIILSLIDLGGLAKGITAVGLLSAMMTAMIYATKGAQDCKSNIIAMTVAIGLMAASIAALSFIDTGKLAAATLALSMVMGMFALVEKMASNLSGAVGSILAISVAIGLLAGILYVLSGIPAETLIPTAVSLSTLLLAMSGALAILSKIGSVSASAIGSMALLGLVVAELGAILGVMAYFNVQPSIETATSLSVLLLAMSGALGILTLVGAGGPAAFIGVGALATLIAAIGGLMVGIGALVTYIPDMQTWLNTGMAVLEQIGYGLGSFFGNIVGGFLGGVSAGLPEIGTNISQFMLNMQPFFTAISGLDEGSTNAVKALAETILILTGAGLIDGITSWLTGGSSLSSFGEQLIPFGEAIKEYGDAVAGINTSGIQQSVDAGKALAELANALPNSGGVAGFFAGENDIDEFAEKLVPFGEAIKEYGDAVAGINTSGIQQSVDAGKALSNLAKVLPNSGGVASFFAGENDIDEFGEQLVTFGKSITAYGEAVANINTSGIQASVTAGHALAELADALPNSGGVAGFFAGNNDMDTFGENLVKFGKSLVNFSNTVSGLNISGITSKLSGFTKALTTLGKTGVDGFVKSFSDDSSKITSAAQIMIVTFVNAAKMKQPSMASAFKTIGSYVVQGFANGISENTYLAEAKALAMANAAKNAAERALGIASPSKAFSKIGNYINEGLAKGIENSTSKPVNAIKKTTKKVKNTAKKSVKKVEQWIKEADFDAFTSIGKTIGDDLAKTMEDAAWATVNTAEAINQKFKKIAKMSLKDIESWLGKAKAFGEINAEEELQLWRMVASKYKVGTEDRLTAEEKLYTAYKTLYKEDYDEFKNWIDDKTYYNEFNTNDVLWEWKQIQAKYAEGTDERKEADRQVYKLENELREEAFENSKSWIDTEKEYNRLSLQEEYEAWLRIQSQYEEGTDKRKEADKQVYKLKHELIDNSVEYLEREIAKQKELISTLVEGTVEYANALKELEYDEKLRLQAKYDNAIEWIRYQDDYNLWDGLSDKLAAYTRTLQYCTKGTNNYKDTAKEIYNIEKEIYEARESYNEDVEKIQNEFAEKRVELEKEKADKIKEINEKLQSDIQATNEKYTSKLESRTKSLYDAYGLFDEVKEKENVNSATLMKNLQDQVDEFKDWQKTLDSLSARGLNESLVEELSEMGPSAIAEIKALSSMSDSQLQQYATLWSTKHKQAKNKAIEELEDLRIETNAEIRNLKIQANKDLDEYCNLWNEKMKTLNKDTSEQLDKLGKEFNKKVGLIKSDTEAEIKKMSETAQSIMREAGWDETGQAIVVGMSNGVGTGKIFIDKIKEVAINAVNAVKDVLEIHSLSRVFAELGMFMDEGIVVGLTKYSDRVSQASKNVGRESISAISSSISRISDVINSDMDVEPTITPVIDLTNVRNGIGMINGAFGANRSMNLGMAIATNNQNGNSYQSELFGKMQDMAEKANGKLTSAIDSLRSDFNDMASKLGRMQVVLDSGALVGEIAPDMDSALGGLAKMNRRGVR